eukprot:XP_001707639.1 Hypothetical protein GL50803_86648 [Giardia lamblia ATCC 50803]
MHHAISRDSFCLLLSQKYTPELLTDHGVDVGMRALLQLTSQVTSSIRKYVICKLFPVQDILRKEGWAKLSQNSCMPRHPRLDNLMR